MTYPVPAVGTRLTADFLTSMLEISVRKAGSTSRASTTVTTADPELVLTVEANAIYSFVCGFWFTALTGASSGGISVTMTGPVGATGDFAISGKDTTTSVGNNNDQQFYAALASNFNLGSIVTNPNGTIMVGTVAIGATSGSLTFTWAQRTSSATATVLLSGSYMQIKRIG
jgi:hypothetical protein